MTGFPVLTDGKADHAENNGTTPESDRPARKTRASRLRKSAPQPVADAD